MKKVMLSLALLCGMVMTANAQEGKMWVGGAVSFDYSKPSGGESTTNWGIIPEFGYFLSDDLAVGIDLGYASGEMSIGEFDVEANMFTVAPFVRYSFMKGDLGGLFVDGGVGYTHFKAKEGDGKADVFEVGFTPGVSVNVTDAICLTGKFGFLGYTHIKIGDNKVNDFGLNVDMNTLQVGVSLLF